jgi:hypothetical protein
MQALDKFDIATSVTSILRRFHLTHLLDHRISREDHRKTTLVVLVGPKLPALALPRMC